MLVTWTVSHGYMYHKEWRVMPQLQSDMQSRYVTMSRSRLLPHSHISLSQMTAKPQHDAAQHTSEGVTEELLDMVRMLLFTMRHQHQLLADREYGLKAVLRTPSYAAAQRRYTRASASFPAHVSFVSKTIIMQWPNVRKVCRQTE